MICNCNPHKTRIKGHLEYISNEIESHSSKYDNFLLLDDFNSEPTEEAMKSFCEIYILKNLLNKYACYKNPTNPSCVDLILINRPRSFQSSCKFETGLLLPLTWLWECGMVKKKVFFCNVSVDLTSK